MSSTFKEHVLARLDQCEHTPQFEWQYRPTEGEELYCYRCRRIRRVVGLVDQYTTTCTDCRFLRRMGQARLNAEIEASKHHRKHPSHEVKLYLGRVLQHTWERQEEDRNVTAIPGF